MKPENAGLFQPIAADMAADLIAALDPATELSHLVEIAILTGMAYMEIQAKRQMEQVLAASRAEANRRDLRRTRSRPWVA